MRHPAVVALGEEKQVARLQRIVPSLELRAGATLLPRARAVRYERDP